MFVARAHDHLSPRRGEMFVACADDRPSHHRVQWEGQWALELSERPFDPYGVVAVQQFVFYKHSTPTGFETN